MTQHAVAASVSAWHDKTEASVSPTHCMYFLVFNTLNNFMTVFL